MGFEGAVLVGGASTRMGREKATLRVPGGTLGGRSVEALRAAGAERIVTVGSAVPMLGVESVADLSPHLGPLGGLVTALAQAEHDIVVVLACDLLGACAELVSTVVGALGAHQAAIATAVGRTHPLAAAYGIAALPALRAALDADELRMHRALRRLDTVTVEVPEAWVANANYPADVEGLTDWP